MYRETGGKHHSGRRHHPPAVHASPASAWRKHGGGWFPDASGDKERKNKGDFTAAGRFKKERALNRAWRYIEK
jgi:hypothetical protein